MPAAVGNERQTTTKSDRRQPQTSSLLSLSKQITASSVSPRRVPITVAKMSYVKKSSNISGGYRESAGSGSNPVLSSSIVARQKVTSKSKPTKWTPSATAAAVDTVLTSTTMPALPTLASTVTVTFVSGSRNDDVIVNRWMSVCPAGSRRLVRLEAVKSLMQCLGTTGSSTKRRKTMPKSKHTSSNR